MAKKSCKKGYYYCNTDKKCKKIPRGYHVMPTGYLMRDSEHQDENKEETNGKKKNGNGNGSNGNGNGNGGSNGGSNGGGVSEAWSAKYKKSIDCDNPKGFSQKAHCRGRKIDEGKDGMSDHEVSMAKGQVRNSITNLKRVEKVLKTMTDKDDLPAWLQAKITDTEHNTDAAAGYMDEEVIAEKRDGKSSKDKGYSLRDWFKGGGWKQTGGKYDGKPCAKQPGQKTKPYCRDADDRAAMSKEERNKRAAKKRKEDPNPNRKGKAKNVTQESYSNWRADLEQLDEMGLANAARIGGALGLTAAGGVLVNKAKEAAEKLRNAADKRMGKPATYQKNSYEPEGDMVDEGKKDACYHKVKSRYSVWPSAYASGALVKCRKVGAANWGNKTKKEGFSNWREDILSEGLEEKLSKMSPEQIENLIKANRGAEDKIRATLRKMKSATPKPQGKGAQLPNVPKQPASTSSATPRETYQRGGSDRVSYQRARTVTRADVQGGTEAAKRAASGQGRYKPGVGVTPDFKLDPKFRPPGSRGMTGGIRPRGRGGKIGAAVAIGSALAPLVIQGVKAIKKRMEPDIGVNKYMQKEDYEFSNWRDDFQATEYESVDIIKAEPLQPTQGVGSDMLDEKKRLANKLDKISGQLKKASAMHANQSKEVAKVSKSLEEAKKCWKGYKKVGTQKLFGKTYNRCEKIKKEEVEFQEDWQKSNRKDGVDGMSQKSVDAYKRENPGSKLQTAVTGKNPKGKDKKRRKSFCARSKGQKDMHNIDCSKTPDKKICKARKRWRC